LWNDGDGGGRQKPDDDDLPPEKMMERDQGRLLRICLINSSSHTAAKTPMQTRHKSNISQIILSPPYA